MREIKIEYILQDKETKEIDKISVSLEQIESNEFKILDCLKSKYTEIIAKRQYTRWKDKNLIDIYDGDIVKSNTNDESDIFAIDMNKLDWFISPKGHAFDNGSIEFEVIGNIYENKELLKCG